MSAITESALRELVDRVAIHDVLLRYARGVDRRDIALVASCFTADAEYEGALARGRINDALAALPARIARYESTMHFIGNHCIELGGDTASSETYATAFHRLNADGERRLLTVAIRYVDQFVRASDGWLIGRRMVHREWERTELLAAR
jgi:hypothetical protein